MKPKNIADGAYHNGHLSNETKCQRLSHLSVLHASCRDHAHVKGKAVCARH